MSYLEDPRVFLATERTLLAWIRTEISILALAFILKKFGIEEGQKHQHSMEYVVIFLCAITVVLSILACIQAHLGIKKLGEKEIPGNMAKPLVMLGGAISIILSLGATIIVAFI